MGFPYTEVIKCPSTTAANTAFMAFGNLRFLAVGRRLDTATLSVDPYGLFLTNRTRYKLYQRWGMKISLRNGLVRMLTASGG
jgi:HK97 family phage major capsid protein